VTDSAPEKSSTAKRTKQLKEELTITLKTSTFFRTLCRQIDALIEDLGVGNEEVESGELSKDEDGKQMVEPVEVEPKRTMSSTEFEHMTRATGNEVLALYMM
jgi:hypothetical protein